WAEPATRAVASDLRPWIWAIICSTGPPGAACTMTKWITMIPRSVGITHRRRRITEASIGRLFLLLLLLLRFQSAAPFRQHRRLVLVDPPCIEAEAVFRGHVGMAELVPVDHPEGPAVPIGDDVEIPLQHAVQRARARDQALAV